MALAIRDWFRGVGDSPFLPTLSDLIARAACDFPMAAFNRNPQGPGSRSVRLHVF